MTPADRAALAASLRGLHGFFADKYIQIDDLLAAAAELERPRPRVEWRICKSGLLAASIGGLDLWRGHRIDAHDYAAAWTAAGFDVDPLPEVDHDQPRRLDLCLDKPLT